MDAAAEAARAGAGERAGGPAPALLAALRLSERLRRQAEERLRQARQLASLGLLAGGVAHDLNNLFTVLRGYAQLLLQEAGGGPETRSIHAEMLNTVLRGCDLVGRLLDICRHQPPVPRSLDLNRLVGEMAPLLRSLLGDGARLEVEPAEGLWPVLADAVGIGQILINLTVNARDATPAGGRVAIRTRNIPAAEGGGDSVLLAVVDNGAGMEPAVLARAGEPLFSAKAPGRGTGLGLALVREIAAAAGGRLELKSEPGRGTEAAVRLPRELPAGGAEAAARG